MYDVGERSCDTVSESMDHYWKWVLYPAFHCLPGWLSTAVIFTDRDPMVLLSLVLVRE